MPDESRLKVLYIGGTGRTGSTILQSILGRLDGVFDAGEMTWFWWALERNGRCSCGEPLSACPVWSEALRDAFGLAGGPQWFDPAEMVALRRRFDSRHLPLMVLPGLRRRLFRRLGDFPGRVDRLYQAIAESTGSRLIVDSSKEPHYSFILRSQPTLDVHFLHLVRDPRAIAYSWRQPKTERGFDGYVAMERRNLLVSATYHNVSNAAAELIWRGDPSRYRFLRYEDFVDRPAETIEMIDEFVGLDLGGAGAVTGSTVELQPTHSAWGNPNRFDRGRVEIRDNDDWKRASSRRDQAITTLLTFPFMRRYGYLGRRSR